MYPSHIVERRDELVTIGQLGRKHIEKYYTLDAFASCLDNFYKEIGIS